MCSYPSTASTPYRVPLIAPSQCSYISELNQVSAFFCCNRFLNNQLKEESWLAIEILSFDIFSLIIVKFFSLSSSFESLASPSSRRVYALQKKLPLEADTNICKTKLSTAKANTAKVCFIGLFINFFAIYSPTQSE